MQISSEHLTELKHAKHLLENPGLAAKMTDFVGTPIEMLIDRLPAKWNEKISQVTQSALNSATQAALYTMKNTPGEDASNKWHKLGVALSGGVGGFFGLAALTVELPVSTTLMLRSIADIARSEGESIDCPETQMACLQVFALGGSSKEDDGTDSGYFAVRSMLAKATAEAAEHLAKHGLAQKAAPVLVRFMAIIAERFGIQITQKAAAQAVPAIGAIGGATINTLFIDHFQDMARGHFIVRKLETKYSAEFIRQQYDQLV
ncbi:EcsC family protein [Shewanella eurypsychrophilus]|uniref:EcsC family protein n=1 Tax=Shewanella eurypsychrophilus TaxID=2593656 RepID=A0ABX6V8R0_9GAMM|nr:MULTISPECIES: EcsC family protein [Shewanella]QFU22910.1 EcsC family protein [Shewanella sp. YLB-09]QPG58196.1 EcsC family protein [Shewanella eurypsychrophilus]